MTENQKLVQFLNRLLSNYFVLYVKLHRYHWFIQGRHFFDLHARFEEMYRQFADDLDKVAERILMIEGRPFAVMSKYIEESTLHEAEADNTEKEMIHQLIEDYKSIISEVEKTGMPYAERLGDHGTADMLTQLKSVLEKYVWMLTAYSAEK